LNEQNSGYVAQCKHTRSLTHFNFPRATIVTGLGQALQRAITIAWHGRPPTPVSGDRWSLGMCWHGESRRRYRKPLSLLWPDLSLVLLCGCSAAYCRPRMKREGRWAGVLRFIHGSHTTGPKRRMALQVPRTLGNRGVLVLSICLRRVANYSVKPKISDAVIVLLETRDL
jgi:hypothetical protein